MDYQIYTDDDGNLIATIRNTDGRVTSTFKGKDYEEISKKLLESQVNANREIARLRKPDAARPQVRIEPKELTAADRLRLSSEITDPSRVVETVEEIMTARSGIRPDALGAEIQRMTEDEQIQFGKQQVDLFLHDYPDYYPVPQNLQAMTGELERNHWDPTRNNLALAYHALKAQNALVDWPS